MGWFLKNALNAEFWIKVKQQAKVWRVGAFPGLAVVGCVVIARLTGSSQVLEWMAFDNFLRLRPAEAEDTRVVIVGIDENDIKAVGDYPVPNRDLAKMLRILQSYKPRAIGLDMFRDLTTDPGHAELAKIFADTPNLVGIEMALGSEATLNVKPPPELPPERVGFADAIIDSDGKLRRSPLASKVGSEAIKYSLPLLLAEIYLRSEGIALEHGNRAGDPIRFGSTVLTRFRSNSGSYVGAKAGGNQVLLNFRSNQKPFPTISMTDIFTGRVKPDLIRDRIVLVGMTAASVNDTFMTSAVKGTLLTAALGNQEPLDQYKLIYGVEIEAHATSQIVNAVLNGRPLLHVWSEGWEYLWILAWGLVGIALGLILQSPWKTLLSIGVASFGLVGICYGLLILSWWVPVVPALLALCGAGLTTSFFDRESRTLDLLHE
jgi:CHASE2 domain-containing sensor protein